MLASMFALGVNLHSAELTLLCSVTCLDQTLLLLCLLRLLDRHNTTPLVVLQVLLGQTTGRVMCLVVHNLRTRTNCLHMCTSFLLITAHLF